MVIVNKECLKFNLELENKKKKKRSKTQTPFIHGSFCFSIPHITCLSPHMLNDILLHAFHFFRLDETVSSCHNTPSLTDLSSTAAPAFFCLNSWSKEDGSTYSLIHMTVSNQCSWVIKLLILYLFTHLFINATKNPFVSHQGCMNTMRIERDFGEKQT